MRIKHFIRSFIWGVLILFLCLLPKSNVPKVQIITIPHFDKWVHAGMFFIFTFLLLLDFKSIINLWEEKKRYVSIIFGITLVHGGLIEILQNYLSPTRSGDWFDWYADIAGTVFGFFIGYFFLKKTTLKH